MELAHFTRITHTKNITHSHTSLPSSCDLPGIEDDQFLHQEAHNEEQNFYNDLSGKYIYADDSGQNPEKQAVGCKDPGGQKEILKGTLIYVSLIIKHQAAVQLIIDRAADQSGCDV